LVSADSYAEKDEKYCLYGIGMPKGVLPPVFVEGYGAIIKDINGKEYLDMIGQTSGVNSIGHAHPKVIAAVKKQLDASLVHSFTSNVNLPRTELAEKLAKIAPGDMRDNCRTLFSSGGSEANEVALKFSMIAKKKHDIISLYRAYHGDTLALMSLIGQSYWRNQPLFPMPGFPGFHQIPDAYCYRCYFGKSYPDCDFECARILEHQIMYGSTNVAAFIFEPIQGNGGVITPPSKEYFKIIREICEKHNVLRIADEVQTGTGKTGRYWASDYFDIRPDIVTTAKGMGSGFPISATMIKSDVVPEDLPDKHWHVFTYGGSPLVCAAASAVVDVVTQEKLTDRARELGARIRKHLNDMARNQRMIGDIRGAGVFLGVELVKDTRTKEPAIAEAEEAIVKTREKGLLLGISGKPGYGNVLEIRAPLVTTDEQADRAIEILDSVLRDQA